MRYIIASIAVLTTLLSIVSCDRAPERAPGEFRFINRGDIITLDLNAMSYLQDFRIAFATREGLYTYDAQTFQPLKALAISDEVTADGLTWTFKLRPDAKWDNADPVTANDFVFSWQLLLQSPGEYTYLLHYIEGAQAYQTAYVAGENPTFDTVGVKAIDPLTLQVRLVNPVPFFRDLMAFPTFYPRHAKSMEPFKQTDSKGRLSYNPEYTRPPQVVTNGPFKLVKWEPGKLLRMEQNEHYWDRKSLNLKALENIVATDAQSSFIQYEQGDIDWLADVSQDIAFPLKEKGRADLRTSPAFGTAFITVNCADSIPEVKDANNPLSDIRVREAISLAIDRSILTGSVTRMGEAPATHYMPPGFFKGYQAKPIATEGGVARAKQLLADAGYPDGKGFPTISLVYNSDNTIRRDLAASISNQLKTNLNITVEGKGIELKSYRNEVTNKLYSLALVAWFGDYMDPSTFTDKYLSNAENNDSNWGPKAYDDLVAQARKEANPDKRLDLLAEAESMVNAELPIIPLYHYVNISLHRDNVKGLFTNAKNLTVFKPISIE
jgi:oligopeptide transport system substrate-binding protein